MNDKKEQTNFEITQVINQPYKYGFQTNIEMESFPPGLNEGVVKLISKKKDEPKYLLDFRLKAYKKWKKMDFPEWANLEVNKIDYDDITYYSVPKTKKKLKSLDEVDPEILETFEKLGISLDEQKKLSNVAVDAVFDSVSIATTYKEKLAKSGVIFCSISEAIKFYPQLVQKFFRNSNFIW